MSNFIAVCSLCGESVACTIVWEDGAGEADVTVAPHTCKMEGMTSLEIDDLSYEGDYINVPKVELGIEPVQEGKDMPANSYWDVNKSD